MKHLRRPNGSDRDRLYATDLLDMEVEHKYAYLTTARVLRGAQIAAGLDRDKLIDAPDTQKLVVHERVDDTTWRFMLV